MTGTVNLDPSARLGTVLLTGYADQPWVVRFYTLTPEGTVADTYDVTAQGRVYTPLDLRSFISFDAEMRPSYDSEETVDVAALRTEAFPYNELTLYVATEDSTMVQGWAAKRGIGTAMGVSTTGDRTPLGQWRWQMRRPSAAR
jgi:hypothetical protein